MKYQVKNSEGSYYGPFASQEKASTWAIINCKTPWTMLPLAIPMGVYQDEIESNIPLYPKGVLLMNVHNLAESIRMERPSAPVDWTVDQKIAFDRGVIETISAVLHILRRSEADGQQQLFPSEDDGKLSMSGNIG